MLSMNDALDSFLQKSHRLIESKVEVHEKEVITDFIDAGLKLVPANNLGASMFRGSGDLRQSLRALIACTSYFTEDKTQDQKIIYPKFCRLVDHLFGKRYDETAVLSIDDFEKLASFFFDRYSLDKSQSSLHVKVLVVILKHCGESMPTTVYKKLWNQFTHDLLKNILLPDQERILFNCISILLPRIIGSVKDVDEKEKALFAFLLEKSRPASSETIQVMDLNYNQLRLHASALRCLQAYLNSSKAPVSQGHADRIMDCLYVFLYAPSVNIVDLPYSLEERMRLLKIKEMESKNKYLPPHLRKSSVVSEMLFSNSDSEMSDGSGGNIQNRKNVELLKARLASFGVLSALSKNPKLLYSHWKNLLPDSHSALESDSSSNSLFNSILHDHFKIRAAAASCVQLLFENSRQYLAFVTDKSTRSAFTSFSEKLGKIVISCHLYLVDALNQEQDTSVLSQLFSLVSTITSQTTYEKLETKLLPHIASATVKQIKNSDSDVSLSATLAIASVLEASHTSKRSSDLSDAFYSDLLETLLTYLMQTSDDKVQGAIFHSIGALCKVQITTVHLRWQSIKQILNPQDSSAAKFLETYTLAAAELPIDDSGLAWWNQLLNDYIFSNFLRSPDNYLIRCSGLECLSNLSSTIFGQLENKQRALIITSALGLCQDEHGLVRAAACRTLGCLVMFSDLEKDVLFITDILLTVTPLLEDGNLATKTKASWALANTCDALIKLSEPSGNAHDKNNETTALSVPEGIKLDLLVQLVRSCISCAGTNEKLKPNTLRIIGDIGRIFPATFLEREKYGLVQEMVSHVIKSITTGIAKTRWNACHAATNILRNPHFPIGLFPSPAFKQVETFQTPYSEQFFDALVSTVTSCKIFKVRIHACEALLVPPTRERYGESTMFVKIYQAICTELQQLATGNFSHSKTPQEVIKSEEVNIQVAEYRYREQLNDTLAVCLVHLTRLISRNDFVLMKAFIIEHGDFLFDVINPRCSSSSFAVSSVDLEVLKKSDTALKSMENLLHLLESNNASVPIELLKKYSLRYSQLIMGK